MTEVEKYILHSGKTLILVPDESKLVSYFDPKCLKAVRIVGRTVISVNFLRYDIRLKFLFLEMM